MTISCVLKTSKHSYLPIRKYHKLLSSCHSAAVDQFHFSGGCGCSSIGSDECEPSTSSVVQDYRQIICGTKYEQSVYKVLPSFPGNLQSIRRMKLIPERKFDGPSVHQCKQANYDLSLESRRLLPSVTALLSSTKDSKFLEIWQSKQIAQHGLEKFKYLSSIRKQEGTDVHTALCTALKIVSEHKHPQPLLDVLQDSLSPEVRPYFVSARPMILQTSDFQFEELSFVNWQLCYRGKVDAVATYRGERRLIEFKTASPGSYHSRMRHATLNRLFDAPEQAVAYVGGLNYDAHVPLQVRSAVIVYCQGDGRAAAVFEMSQDEMRPYWIRFRNRLYSFWKYLQFQTEYDANAPVNFAGAMAQFDHDGNELKN